MNPSYDVIVVGAGLGGLSAATRLAKSGLSVLLLERHNIPGGYATSFVRGRFEFEVALHELSGVGAPDNPGSMRPYLEELGLLERLELLPVPELYRSVFPEHDIVFPHGEEAFVGTLCEHFPEEADGIRKFMRIIFALDDEVRELEKVFASGSLSVGGILGRLHRIPHAARYLPVTWGEVLDAHVKSPAARAVISQLWGYFGLPPSKLSFFYFAIGLASYIRFGATFPRHRSQALSNAFLDTFQELGGEAALGCGVKRILHKGGRALGVMTDDGREIMADRIVTNVDPFSLAYDLIGEDQVPPAYVRRLRRRKIGASSCNVYLGLDASPQELGINCHEAFINESYDIETHWGKMHGLETPGGIALTTYNLVYPEISPPGTSIAVLTALMYGKPWMNLEPERYHETKRDLAERILNMAEGLVPGLRGRAEVVEVSTPLTNIRYASNVYGAIYGFEQPPWDQTILRFGQRGPLEGMFQVGAFTQPGGGFQPAIMSGQLTSMMLLKDLKG